MTKTRRKAQPARERHILYAEVPGPMLAELRALSESDGRRTAWHVRKAMRAYLDALAVDGVSPGPTRLA